MQTKVNREKKREEKVRPTNIRFGLYIFRPAKEIQLGRKRKILKKKTSAYLTVLIFLVLSDS